MRVKGRKRSWIFHNLVMESHGKVMKFNRPEGAGTLYIVTNTGEFYSKTQNNVENLLGKRKNT